MDFYSDPFYSDDFFDGNNEDIPINLDYYRTNVDNVYVFYWTFQPSYISSTLATLDFELQIDKVNTFDSPDLQTFTKTTAISYQNGNIVKGFTIPVYAREEDIIITFYARVRGKSGLNYSDFSDILTAETIPSVVKSTEDRLLLVLPDNHTYPRDEVALPLVDRTSNISKVFWEYSTEFDREYLEKENTIWDATLRFTRDDRIYDIFGYRFGFPKPSTMQYVDYRYLLRNVHDANFVGSTYAAAKGVGRGFTGVNPIIVPFSQLTDFITAKETRLTTVIPSTGPYTIALATSPRNVPKISGFIFKGDPNDTPSPSAPAAGEFVFNHLTNVLTFNVADAGTSIIAVYSSLADIYTHLDPINPPAIYTRKESGFAVKIILQNPGGFILDLSLIYFLMSQVVPAHIRFVLVT